MTKEITKDIVVIYHGGCRDGFTAAWAAWKKLADKADYVPVIWTNQSEQIPPLKNKEVYFLDYVPIQEKLDKIVKANKSVQIIDHHISREKEAKSLPGSVFDITHSAAVLSWKFFHPNTVVPKLSLYVEDSDIWKWNIPNSAQILEAIDLKKQWDFNIWEEIARDLEDELKTKEYIEKGNLIKQYLEKIIEDVVEGGLQVVNFEGHQVHAINSPRVFKSEIGMMLADKKPPFAIVWCELSNEISVSLRSVRDFDLTPIASKYGGGGHRNASNFRLSLDVPLPWKIIKEDEK